MGEWIVSPRGEPVCILDEYCFRNLKGEVSAWLFGDGVYALDGEHTGWYVSDTLFDIQLQVLGTNSHAFLGMPEFHRRPRVPTLKPRHDRASRSERNEA